jgi:hypothetical protein
VDSNGRTIWIADAHRDNGKRFVVHAEEKLTAFAELEAAIRIGRTPRGRRSALASTGGVEGSFFTAQRCSPWLSRHEQGDSKVTGGDSAAAVLKRKVRRPNANSMRIIATVHIILSLPCGEQKRQNRAA